MWWFQKKLTGVIAAVMVVSSAHGLCIYNGQMYAKTTVAQEFADSKWVVRAKVISADEHWSDEDDSWAIYHLQTVTRFKGKSPDRIEMFTYRDSGGFYLNKGMFADLGGEYLLFLDPLFHPESAPAQAQHAMNVNYACGQSKLWSLVSKGEQQQLVGLSHKR